MPSRGGGFRIRARTGRLTDAGGKVKTFLKRHLPARYLVHLLAWKNYWFNEPELRLLGSLVDPARAAIDIGANRGIYTYFLSKLATSVYAYEPNPEMMPFLRATVRPNVVLRDVALSNAAGVSELLVPIISGEAVDGWGGFKKVDGVDDYQVFEVSKSRLDDEDLDNIGFVKIDVEGHEGEVIEGASGFLKSQRPVLQIEIEQRHLAGKEVDEVFELVRSQGYDGFFYRAGELRPISEFSVRRDQLAILEKYGEPPADAPYINNFIFKPR